MDGIYATHTVQNPYLDEASQPFRFWANKYKTKFNEDPTVFSVYGYSIIDPFVKAAQKAGPSLTTDSFVKAMDTHDLRARHVRRPQEPATPPPSAWATTSRACRRSPTASGRWCRTT